MRKQAGKRPERKKPARLISKAHLLERVEREAAFDAARRGATTSATRARRNAGEK